MSSKRTIEPTLERTKGLEMRRIGLRACPYCHSSEVYVSSAKTFWERLSGLLLLRHVRCDECRRHFRPVFLSALTRPSRRGIPRTPEIAPGEGKEQPRV